MNNKLLVTSITLLVTSGCIYLARKYRKTSAIRTALKHRLIRNNLLAMSKGIGNQH